MGKLHTGAFAVMAICEKTKKHFGLTIDPRGKGSYAMAWAFKINPDQGKREGYDRMHINGAVGVDDDFNGCPYCGTKNFYLCSGCGKVVCTHGQSEVTCPNCGHTGMIVPSTTFDIRGGGF